jgi:hypothetical protein
MNGIEEVEERKEVIIGRKVRKMSKEIIRILESIASLTPQQIPNSYFKKR